MVPQPFRVFGRDAARLLALGVAILGLSSVSCQDVPLLAPSTSTLTIILSADTLSASGTINVTATLVQGSGTPSTPGNGATTTPSGVAQPVHDGTQVTFTTSLGTIDPVTATTKGGQVTVQLSGNGQTGTAKITAFSGTVTASTTITVS
jgi:hypothetical protein